MKKIHVRQIRPVSRSHATQNAVMFAAIPVMQDSRWNAVARSQAVRVLTARGIEPTDHQIAAYFETLRARLSGLYSVNGRAL